MKLRSALFAMMLAALPLSTYAADQTPPAEPAATPAGGAPAGGLTAGAIAGIAVTVGVIAVAAGVGESDDNVVTTTTTTTTTAP